MGKDPAFLFYPNDWLGGTLGMTFEEKGAYLELLMLQFNRGHMSGHMAGQVVGQLWVKIKDKFILDDNGLYYNERLEQEIERRKSYVASRKNNLSGKNQYSNKEGHMESHKEGHTVGHMENENEDEDISVINKDKESAERKRKDDIPYDNIKDLWNNTVEDLPQVQRLTDSRRKHIKARYREDGYEKFVEVFYKVNASDFLSGRMSKATFRCGFDWVLNPSNWAKIIEGTYDNRQPTLFTPPTEEVKKDEPMKPQRVNYQSRE